MKTPSNLISKVLEGRCELIQVTSTSITFKIIEYNSKISSLIMKCVIRQIGDGSNDINIETFAILIKKWAFKKGFLIQDNGANVKIYEKEFSSDLFSLESASEEYISETIFEPQNIINAGVFVLGGLNENK